MLDDNLTYARLSTSKWDLCTDIDKSRYTPPAATFHHDPQVNAYANARTTHHLQDDEVRMLQEGGLARYNEREHEEGHDRDRRALETRDMETGSAANGVADHLQDTSSETQPKEASTSGFTAVNQR